MTIDQWLELAKTFVSLVQVCIWPLLLLFILLFLGGSLKKFLQNMGEFTLKASTSGIEATAKREKIEAAALLGAAAAKNPSDEKLVDEDKARQIAQTVSTAVDTVPVNRLRQASILWVDDRPRNNTYARQAMEALGMQFVLATSTEEALAKVQMQHFDVIISDMGRPPDSRAGYTLLDALKRNRIDVPYIIYAGSNSAEHNAETKRRGGYATTDSPQELFQLVIEALQQR